jgi:hypothetical protein
MSAGSGRVIVTPSGGAATSGYTSVGLSGNAPTDLDITIPAGMMAITGWSGRGPAGGVWVDVTVTTLSGSAPTSDQIAGQGLAGGSSFAGGGYIYSASGGVYRMHMVADPSVADGHMWAIVVAVGSYDTSMGT